MNTTAHAIDPQKISAIAAMFAQDADDDQVILRMRQMGLDKIDSIKMVRQYKAVSLGKAKDIVHLSPAWDDRYEADERLHDVCEEALALDAHKSAGDAQPALEHSSRSQTL